MTLRRLILAAALCAPMSAYADDTQSPWGGVSVRSSQIAKTYNKRVKRAPLDIRTDAQLVAVAAHYVGRGKFTRLAGPWCRDALNTWLRQAGYYTDGDRRARAVARIVRSIGRPVPGAIAWQGHHTGIVASVSGNRVVLISGNYSRRVKVHTASIHSYRYGLPSKG